jgi:hypothetical protein
MLSERDNIVTQWRQEEATTREEMTKLKLDHERQIIKARSSTATGSDAELAKRLDQMMVRIDVLGLRSQINGVLETPQMLHLHGPTPKSHSHEMHAQYVFPSRIQFPSF